MDAIFLTQGQLRVFFAYFGIGVCVGASYTVSRLIDAVLGRTRASMIFSDLVFGVGAGMVVVWLSRLVNYSEWRGYLVIAVVIGALGYLLTVHKGLAIAMKKVYNKIASRRSRKQRQTEEHS